MRNINVSTILTYGGAVMKKILFFFVLFILGISCVPYSYSQNIEEESLVTVYIASDFSRTTYSPIFSSYGDENSIGNNWVVPVFGLNVKLSEAFYGSFRAEGYSIWNISNDIYSNVSIRNYMMGFKVKNPDHPFFIYVMAGLNTIDYNLEGVEDHILPINKSLVLGGNAGLKMFRTKRLSYDLSIGYNKSFDKDLSTNKIYLQLSLPFIVF